MNAPANSPWLEERERGSRSATRLMKGLALTCGRRIARLLLYPICKWYASVKARRQYWWLSYL